MSDYSGEISLSVDPDQFRRRVDNFLGHTFIEFIRDPGPDVMLKIHRVLADEFDPYVPRQNDDEFDDFENEDELFDADDTDDELGHTGHMADNVQVTADSITYPGPYAHYMYEGIIYGPNIPKYDKDGNIVGWRSPKGKSKYPTGRPFNYSNPQATSHWDKAALTENWDRISQTVRRIIIEAWKNEH